MGATHPTSVWTDEHTIMFASSESRESRINRRATPRGKWGRPVVAVLFSEYLSLSSRRNRATHRSFLFRIVDAYQP
jgi:hypothetical protein